MQSTISRFFILWIGVVFFVSCKKEGTADTAAPQQDYRDISYGTNAAQKLDIYLPQGRTTSKTKTLVFIHGGSWSAGDKTDFDADIAQIRTMLTDYAIFNINYRLASPTGNQYPTQITDIQQAIQFVQSKASEYQVDATKIGLVGFSAGSHLALLYGYKNNTSGSIKAVVDLFGPTDLTDLYFNHPVPSATQPVLVNFLGTTPVANASLYMQASPVNYVTAQSPPTIIFHGTADPVVPISQAAQLNTKLQTAGVTHSYITYVGEGHGWVGPNLNDTHVKAAAFIKANVK